MFMKITECISCQTCKTSMYLRGYKNQIFFGRGQILMEVILKQDDISWKKKVQWGKVMLRVVIKGRKEQMAFGLTSWTLMYLCFDLGVVGGHGDFYVFPFEVWQESAWPASYLFIQSCCVIHADLSYPAEGSNADIGSYLCPRPGPWMVIMCA